MKPSLVKAIGLSMFIIFAAVGALFVLAPDAVLRFMNATGRTLKMIEAPLGGAGFFPGLAGAYMYVVSVLAWQIFRHPGVRVFPLLLAHAKTASGALSFALFLFHRPYFVLLANALVDLGLGLLAISMFRSIKPEAKATGP
jgi:hypothetical protein